MSESIDSHAFDKTLDGDIRALINHDSSKVLGRSKAGTAEFRVDEHGLWGSVLINEQDTDAMNAWARVQRGDVDQASFGFTIISEERKNSPGKVHWTLTEVELFEVSICTFPAYEATSVSARADERRALEARKAQLWLEKAKERVKKWH